MVFFIGQLAKGLNDLLWKVKEEKYDKPNAAKLKRCNKRVKDLEQRIRLLEDKIEHQQKQRNEAFREARELRGDLTNLQASYAHCRESLEYYMSKPGTIVDVDDIYPNYE